MASITFKERFRNKSSIISHDGSLSISPDLHISKPLRHQVHTPVIRSSSKSALSFGKPSKTPQPITSYRRKIFYSSPSIQSNKSSQNVQSSVLQDVKKKYIKRSKNNSIAPLGSRELIKLDIKKSSSNTPVKSMNYTPYTLNDYNNIKSQKYYRLGGLGPSTIGTKDWVKKKEFSDKQKQYGQQIAVRNVSRLILLTPLQNKESANCPQSRKKIVFAGSRLIVNAYAKKLYED